MNKKEYARNMVKFHSRLLIKWCEYLAKEEKTTKKEEEQIKGQMNLFGGEK